MGMTQELGGPVAVDVHIVGWLYVLTNYTDHLCAMNIFWAISDCLIILLSSKMILKDVERDPVEKWLSP